MNENARRADFARYGIAWSDRRGYEDDHLVPLCLGGADAQENRWPEPGWGIWNSHEKDRLEGYVCRSARVNSISARRNDGFSRRPIGEMPIGGFLANRGEGLSPTPGDTVLYRICPREGRELMRWVIGGGAYDTETASFIARGDHGHEMSEAWWSLYRTRRGAFFEVVAGHDGVIEEVNPLADEQARRFLETNASYLVEKYFGPVPEAGLARFSRSTVIAAIQMMGSFNHAELTLFLLKLGHGLASKVGEKGSLLSAWFDLLLWQSKSCPLITQLRVVRYFRMLWSRMPSRFCPDTGTIPKMRGKRIPTYHQEQPSF